MVSAHAGFPGSKGVRDQLAILSFSISRTEPPRVRLPGRERGGVRARRARQAEAPAPGGHWISSERRDRTPKRPRRGERALDPGRRATSLRSSCRIRKQYVPLAKRGVAITAHFVRRREQRHLQSLAQ